jgi:hypothetical protein
VPLLQDLAKSISFKFLLINDLYDLFKIASQIFLTRKVWIFDTIRFLAEKEFTAAIDFYDFLIIFAAEILLLHLR